MRTQQPTIPAGRRRRGSPTSGPGVPKGVDARFDGAWRSTARGGGDVVSGTRVTAPAGTHIGRSGAANRQKTVRPRSSGGPLLHGARRSGSRTTDRSLDLGTGRASPRTGSRHAAPEDQGAWCRGSRRTAACGPRGAVARLGQRDRPDFPTPGTAQPERVRPSSTSLCWGFPTATACGTRSGPGMFHFATSSSAKRRGRPERDTEPRKRYQHEIRRHRRDRPDRVEARRHAAEGGPRAAGGVAGPMESTCSTARGLPQALEGTQVVVDAANAPAWALVAAVLDFFQASSRHLLAADNGRRRTIMIMLSVVGVLPAPRERVYSREGRAGAAGRGRAHPRPIVLRNAVLRVHRPDRRTPSTDGNGFGWHPSSSSPRQRMTSRPPWPMSRSARTTERHRRAGGPGGVPARRARCACPEGRRRPARGHARRSRATPRRRAGRSVPTATARIDEVKRSKSWG